MSSVGTSQLDAAVVRALTSCVAATGPTALCPVPSGTVRAVPGTVRGTIVGDTVKIQLAVDNSADGRIDIAGSFIVNGSYETLDYNNQASAATGEQTVTFSAGCYASTPTEIELSH